jgi:hypothetical protein
VVVEIPLWIKAWQDGHELDEVPALTSSLQCFSSQLWNRNLMLLVVNVEISMIQSLCKCFHCLYFCSSRERSWNHTQFLFKVGTVWISGKVWNHKGWDWRCMMEFCRAAAYTMIHPSILWSLLCFPLMSFIAKSARFCLSPKMVLFCCSCSRLQKTENLHANVSKRGALSQSCKIQ